MILIVDAIGKRYSMLPSRVLSEASTFDLFIMDAAITYENHVQEKAYKKHNPGPEQYMNQPVEDENMLDALEKFKQGRT
jgi:hypothetical protein